MAYDPPPESLANSYVIKGYGLFAGCLNVQGKLAYYGVCRYACWDPGPPHWRFLYDTHLNRQQILAVLGDGVDRWAVEID